MAVTVCDEFLERLHQVIDLKLVSKRLMFEISNVKRVPAV